MEQTKKLTKIDESIHLKVDFEGISKQILKYVAQAGDIVIKKEDDVLMATDLGSAITAEIKRLEAEAAAKVKPLKDYTAMISDEFKGRLAPLKTARDMLVDGIRSYRAAEAAKVAAANAKILERAEKKAEKTGTEVAPVVLRAEPPKTIATQTAKAKASLVWTYEIVDEAKLPDAYIKKTPNLQALRAAVNGGVREIPGVRVFQQENISFN